MKPTRIFSLVSLTLAAAFSSAAGPAFVFDFSSAGVFNSSGGSYTVRDTVLPGSGADLSTLPVKELVYSYDDLASTFGNGIITLVDDSKIGFFFTGTIIPQGTSSNALNGAVLSFSGGTG